MARLASRLSTLLGAGNLPPVVTSLSVTEGRDTGGTSTAISGQNFSGVVDVLVGGVSCPVFVVNSSTSITATTPAGVVGLQDVSVLAPWGMGTLSAAFRYTPTFTYTPVNDWGFPGRKRIRMTGTTDFGTDVSTLSDLDPTFTLIKEQRAIAEVYARMLQTPRGSLFYAPNRGIDVRQWLNTRIVDTQQLDRWRREIEAEGERDERIEKATASLSYDRTTGELLISVQVQSAAGPFTMVLSVTALTLSIIEVA